MRRRTHVILTKELEFCSCRCTAFHYSIDAKLTSGYITDASARMLNLCVVHNGGAIETVPSLYRDNVFFQQVTMKPNSTIVQVRELQALTHLIRLVCRSAKTKDNQSTHDTSADSPPQVYCIRSQNRYKKVTRCVQDEQVSRGIRTIQIFKYVTVTCLFIYRLVYHSYLEHT